MPAERTLPQVLVVAEVLLTFAMASLLLALAEGIACARGDEFCAE